MRDVIIVGGGPAGTAIARNLAERGLDVALYEKRQEIGAPKRCGEGLSSDSIQELGLDIPERCKRQPIHGAMVYSPNFDFVEVDFEETVGWILERKQFDKWRAKQAAKAGAEIRTKARVKDLLENNKGVEGEIEGEPFKEEAKLVVAADGVESLITRKAGIRQAPQLDLVDSGYQYEMADVSLENPNEIKLYFGVGLAPRGYGWIFPKGEKTANVGVGILGSEEKTAKHYLDKFIQDRERLNRGSVLEVNSGMIPVGGFLDSMVTDNCLAVGDAANQVNPLHGGGMAEGMKAAQIATDVIQKALREGDTTEENLEEYDERWWEERGKRLQKAEKLREVLEEFSDDDLNYLAEELGGKDLIDFVHGKNLSKIGKLLLKRPGMAKHARKLI